MDGRGRNQGIPFPMVSFTVVICTHDRAALLGRLLDSLDAAEDPPGGGCSILVVANACRDETEAMLDERQRSMQNLRWLREPTPGKSHALNRAIEALDRETVAVFADDDHRVPPDFLVQVARALAAEPDIGMFCGRIQPDWDGTEPEWVHEQGPYPIYPRPIPRFYAGDEPRFISGAEVLPGGGNLMVRRPVFDTVGGFHTGLGPAGHNLGGAEDGHFIRRALAAGERLYYVPAVVQYHAVIKEHLRLPYLMRKSYQRSRAVACTGSPQGSGVPLYLWRKGLTYALQSLVSLPFPARRRFYLVRFAAALGEIRGMREAPAIAKTDG